MAVSWALPLSLLLVTVAAQEPTPVILWHGMGDSCCLPTSMGMIKRTVEENIPGVYVRSLMIGPNIIDDTLNGFFMPIDAQVEEACQKIAADESLQGGYNAMGFSQGGQFLRAVAQRCPSPPMKNLITFGGQHQGVFGLPNCLGTEGVCEIVRELLDYGAYESFVQSHLAQAQYWHDPLKQQQYVEVSQFLADINNERDVKNETYKENLNKLENLVLVMFSNDTMVVPRESSHFGFYALGQDQVVVPLQQTPIYTEDYLGLQQLDADGKLAMLETEGDHLQFSIDWLVENIINVYLK
ncbi:palmitoyl-protein thioesterase 1-like [Amphibalanus amphitrite]|uniref:palmitoyl-protein thioesterase 1-like n=1 Tax=Amphibalanus amphitrite TaxID=1232801 RepID=UPI001C91E559|nr:palmitoyl-protein thioesterase 1-like [Amphibalanus amphitrite]